MLSNAFSGANSAVAPAGLLPKLTLPDLRATGKSQRRNGLPGAAQPEVLRLAR